MSTVSMNTVLCILLVPFQFCYAGRRQTHYKHAQYLQHAWQTNGIAGGLCLLHFVSVTPLLPSVSFVLVVRPFPSLSLYLFVLSPFSLSFTLSSNTWVTDKQKVYIVFLFSFYLSLLFSVNFFYVDKRT